MKILGINGSPLGSGESIRRRGAELADLCELRIEYCNACGTCYKTERCIHEDDFQELYDKILVSGGLVLGSPVYFGSVTAQMKTLIDRMSDSIHCQLLHGKYGCAVSTAGSPRPRRGQRVHQQDSGGHGCRCRGERGREHERPLGPGRGRDGGLPAGQDPGGGDRDQALRSRAGRSA